MSEPTLTPHLTLVIAPNSNDPFFNSRLDAIAEKIRAMKNPSHRMWVMYEGDEDRWKAIYLMRHGVVSQLRFVDESRLDQEIVRWATQCQIPIVPFNKSEGAKDAKRANEDGRAEGVAEQSVSEAVVGAAEEKDAAAA